MTRTLWKGREIEQGIMAGEDRGDEKDPKAESALERQPNEAEIAELLHYFQGVASPNARRQIIAKARAASGADPVPAGHFETDE